MLLFVDVQQHNHTYETVTITVDIPEDVKKVEVKGSRILLDGKRFFKASTSIRRVAKNVKWNDGKCRQVQIYPVPEEMMYR